MGSPRFVLVLVASFLLLPGCGGGGGDGGTPPIASPVVSGNVPAPSTGPGDTAEYFPNGIGNGWTLDYTATDSGSRPVTGRLTVSVTGTKSVMGVNATILAQVDSGSGIGSSENYYYLSPGGITHYGNNDSTDTLTPQIVPYAQLLFPVSSGTVSSVTGKNLPLGTDSYGNPLTLDMAQQVVNTGFEDITVAAGSFVGALRQTTTTTGTVNDPKLSQTVMLSSTDERWWVPHVGIVKETSSTTIDTQTTTSSAELRGYVVNGVQRGLGLEFTAVDGLSPSDNSGPSNGRPVVGTDGSSFLILARRASGTLPSYTTDWLATPVQLDGTVGASTSISTPTTVTNLLTAQRTGIAFDGTNYLVVYERDNNFDSTGNHPSLMAQRVSPSGAMVGIASEVASAGTNSPALAFDGTNYLLVFSRSNSYGDFGQLMGVFISPLTGQAMGAEFAISAAQGYQFDPAVAFDGTNYLVVWDQGVWVPQSAGVYAARVSPAGNVMDSGGFAIYSDPINGAREHQAAVVFDGTNYVVLWRYFQPDGLHANLHAMRVSTSGLLLDGTASSGGVAVTTGPNNSVGLPTATMFSGNVLVAWVGDCGNGCGLYGARLITPTNVNNPISVLGAPGFRFTPGGPYPGLAVAAGGALLIWLNYAATPAFAVGAMRIYPFGP
jgi:hypothetical protein